MYNAVRVIDINAIKLRQRQPDPGQQLQGEPAAEPVAEHYPSDNE